MNICRRRQNQYAYDTNKWRLKRLFGIYINLKYIETNQYEREIIINLVSWFTETFCWPLTVFAHLFSCLYCVFCFVSLRPMSCVPNVASVSVLAFLIATFLLMFVFNIWLLKGNSIFGHSPNIIPSGLLLIFAYYNSTTPIKWTPLSAISE